MNNDHYLFSTLAKNPQYYDEVISLIENEFHYGEIFHYAIDFAPLMTPNNFENCYILIDKKENKVACHIAFNKRIMIKNNSELPVVFIGGIVTRKENRNQKLFAHLMNKVINENNEAGLFFLWSDIQDLYEKFDFHLAGGLVETGKHLITSDRIPNDFYKTSFDKLTNKETNQIANLYKEEIESKFFTVKRDNHTWSTIKEMNSVDLYLKKDSHQNIISYFCVGKGRDLSGIIHEFAAKNQKEVKKELAEFKLWLPEYFKNDFVNIELQYTSFIKIGNLGKLNDFFHGIKLDLTIESINTTEVKFNFNNQFHNISNKEFIRYLLGPNPLIEFDPFQLSPYISGLDSV